MANLVLMSSHHQQVWLNELLPQAHIFSNVYNMSMQYVYFSLAAMLWTACSKPGCPGILIRNKADYTRASSV